jgi:HAD superfamily hydrolase (TIGR01662 family)
MDKRITIGLARDGVINKRLDGYCYTVKDFKPIPGSLESIVNLKQFNFAVVLMNAEPGIEHGMYDSYAVNDVEAHISKILYQKGNVDLDAYYHSPFADPNDNGRMPQTGMFRQIEREVFISFHKGFYVGDKLEDLQGAYNFDVTPILVRTGFGKLTEERLKRPENVELAAKTKVFNDLAAFQAWVCLKKMPPVSLTLALHPNVK